MSRPPSSASSSAQPQQRRSFYNTNSSSSTSQLHNLSPRTASSTGPAQGFFDRHNFFGRNSRPRTSAGAGRSEIPEGQALPANNADTSAINLASALTPRRPTSSRSTSHNPAPQHSPERSRSNADDHLRVGFPSSSSPFSASALRSPYQDDTEDIPSSNNPASSPSTGRRLFGMAAMARTSSSGGNSMSASTPGNTAPANGNDRSGSAFGRMFRRYSHGQGRTSSNATDPSTIPGGLFPHSASSSSFAARPNSMISDAVPQASNGSSPALPQPSPSGAASASRVSPNTSAAPSTDQPAVAPTGTNPSVQAGIHRIRLVPHLEATRSLHFEPIERDVRESAVAVKIGRFTDRHPPPPAPSADDAQQASTLTSATATGPTGAGPGNRGGAVPTSAGGGGRVDSARIAFKSKVVSRGHAEVWCEPGGKFFIRDTKSSSGTFLNHIRLSAPNVESRPHSIKDGDILQLGVDYQGGTEEIYRCVKIRVELNRGWQREANQFNVNALRQLRALQGSPMGVPVSGKSSSEAPASSSSAAPSSSLLPTNRQSMSVTDCCICLFSVTVCQALFIAPCSHVFHYKCIRPLLNQHHPGFSCPLCRTFADLEADVEQDEAWQEALIREAEAVDAARQSSSNALAISATRNGGGVGSTDSSSHGHGERARGGTAAATPSQEVAGLDLSSGHAQVDAVLEGVSGVNLGGQQGSTGLHGASSGPAVSSPLRQQVARSTLERLGTADRPGTAVDQGAQAGAAAFLDYDVTMTAIGAGGAMSGDDSLRRSDSAADMDDEAEEVLDDGRLESLHGGAGGLGHEIDRISEEGERSETSMDGSNGGGSGSYNAMQRRPSQPINIASGAGSSSVDSSRRAASGDRSGGHNSSGYTTLAGYSGFSPLEEARTPVNQHVLSVLAEAPPPGSTAARRFAEHQQQRRASGADLGVLGERRPSAVPSEDLNYFTPRDGNSLSGHDDSGSRKVSGTQQYQKSAPLPPQPMFDSREADGGRSSSTFTTDGEAEGELVGSSHRTADGDIGERDESTNATGSGDKGKYRREESGSGSRSTSRSRTRESSAASFEDEQDQRGPSGGSKMKKIFFKRNAAPFGGDGA